MKINDILNEYILVGNPEPNGITYVYLYRTKYALESTEPLTYVKFQLPPELIQEVIQILANSDKFTDDYNSWVPVLTPYQEKIRNNIIKNSQLVSTANPDVEKIFRDALSQRSSEQLLSDIMSSISYRDPKIKHQAAAQELLQNPQLLQNKISDFTISIMGPTKFVKIDHDAKTIQRVDRSAEYKTRMGGYTSKSSQYLLIHGDFSMEPQQFLKLSRDLLKKYPGYEVVEKTPQSLSANKKLQQILQGRGPITAYHGTSNATLTKVKFTKKLIPGQGPEYSDKIKGHSERMIYLTLDPDVARRYAIRASQGRPYVILEITVNDLSRLRFDEDSLAASAQAFVGSTRKSDMAVKRLFPAGWFNADGELEKDWYNIYELIKSVYNPAAHGALVAVENRSKIANYVFYKALHIMRETSFAYEGSIPARDIKIFEKSKSRKYTDKTSSDDYAELEKEAERGRQ